MPAIPALFNRFFAASVALACSVSLVTSAAAQIPSLSAADTQWLGERIFANECNSREACLTSWNEGEDFPSLGIGHFIWYQHGQNERFEESFPDLLRYYRSRNVTLPDWIEELPTLDSPFRSRKEFLDAQDSEQLVSLRDFMRETMPIQVDFIVNRSLESLPAMLAAAQDSKRERIAENFQRVANSDTPYGLYALIDYAHFKGNGVSRSERYHGQGWGLLQVLENMLPNEAGTLQSFVSSARLVLEIRVANAPADRWEKRWLEGWVNRLNSYLPN